MQLFVRAVELNSYEGSFSTTRMDPVKSELFDKNHAMDDPYNAPPIMTTS